MRMDYYKESQAMYDNIIKDMKTMSPISSNDENWYSFVKNVIGLSDKKANDILWNHDVSKKDSLDWSRTYEELDMLDGDSNSLYATIEDEWGV